MDKTDVIVFEFVTIISGVLATVDDLSVVTSLAVVDVEVDVIVVIVIDVDVVVDVDVVLVVVVKVVLIVVLIVVFDVVVNKVVLITCCVSGVDFTAVLSRRDLGDVVDNIGAFPDV